MESLLRCYLELQIRSLRRYTDAAVSLSASENGPRETQEQPEVASCVESLVDANERERRDHKHQKQHQSGFKRAANIYLVHQAAPA
jgi:hypothetical protein